MKKILCIGGPKDGLRLTYEEVSLYSFNNYIQFNCAHKTNQSKQAKARALLRGLVIPDSSVFVYIKTFEEKV